MTRRLTLFPLALALVAVGGCIETGLGGRTNRNDPSDDTDITVFPKGDVTTWPPRDDEYCNGYDDDGDGEIDEGFEDLDQDGIADCVDNDCDIDMPAGGAIPIDDTCTANDGPHDIDPWDVTVEWSWRGLTAPYGTDGSMARYENILMAPIVGNLTDDNMDGFVDNLDTPEIITVAFVEPSDLSGYLVALDGETGEELLRQPGWLPFGGIVVADIDHDGATEIVGFDSEARPKAIRPDGTAIWSGLDSVRAASSTYPQATVADLDGDGLVEVLADNLVLDGETGKVLFEAAIDDKIIGRMPAVGDIDLDGLQEFAMGQDVYEFDRRSGSVVVKKEWSTPVRGTYGHWSAILDADGDLFGEVAMIGDGRLVIHEHDGPIAVDVGAGTDQPGPPCVADFDGDGRRDLVNSVPDALASTANYLKKAGWVTGMPWGYEVRLPKGYNGPSGRKNRATVTAWGKRGITHLDGGKIAGEARAGLLLPAGADGPAFLVFKNFDAIYSYNVAESYALAISHLADRLRGKTHTDDKLKKVSSDAPTHLYVPKAFWESAARGVGLDVVCTCRPPHSARFARAKSSVRPCHCATESLPSNSQLGPTRVRLSTHPDEGDPSSTSRGAVGCFGWARSWPPTQCSKKAVGSPSRR